MDAELTLTEVAKRIQAHLTRFERDASINAPSEVWGTRPYYYASAYRAGRYVGVRYIGYQSTSNLTREEAIAYLARLDSGFVGKHYTSGANEGVG